MPTSTLYWVIAACAGGIAILLSAFVAWVAFSTTLSRLAALQKAVRGVQLQLGTLVTMRLPSGFRKRLQREPIHSQKTPTPTDWSDDNLKTQVPDLEDPMKWWNDEEDEER